MPVARRGPRATSADYQRCRAIGHSWDPIPVTDPPGWGVAIDLRCEFCHTVRRDIRSRYTGERLSRRYFYDDEYKDPDHRTRNEWWGMWVTTLSDTMVSYGDEDERELQKSA